MAPTLLADLLARARLAHRAQQRGRREGLAKEDAPDPDISESMVGGYKRVAEQVAMMRDAGVRNLMLTNRGLVSQEKAKKSLTLLSEKIMPSFR